MTSASMEEKQTFDVSRLSDKTKAFIRHYIVTKSGAESARLAGYSTKSARSKASELLANPDIRKHIDSQIDWSFEEWAEKVKKVYLDNPDNWQASLKSLELYGKSKGFIREAQLTVNQLTLGEADIDRMRSGIAQGIQAKLLQHKQLAQQAVSSMQGIEASPTITSVKSADVGASCSMHGGEGVGGTAPSHP